MTPQPTDADRERADEFFDRRGDAHSHADLTARFAEVRAVAYAQGRADEIEACAKACEALVWTRNIEWWMAATKQEASSVAARECATAIRARAAQEGASDA